nr:hypothetical protein [Candidatus Sigynarchaeota archaeon]
GFFFGDDIQKRVAHLYYCNVVVGNESMCNEIAKEILDFVKLAPLSNTAEFEMSFLFHRREFGVILDLHESQLVSVGRKKADIARRPVS